MKLYLIRHAAAAAELSRESNPGLADGAAARLLRVTEGLVKMDVKPDLLISSPARVARETADILSQGLGEVQIRSLMSLTANVLPESLHQSLQEFSGLESLAIVGHEPQLSRLASLLLTGSIQLCELNFKKLSVACLSGRLWELPGRFVLEWFMTPRALRRL